MNWPCFIFYDFFFHLEKRTLTHYLKDLHFTFHLAFIQTDLQVRLKNNWRIHITTTTIGVDQPFFYKDEFQMCDYICYTNIIIVCYHDKSLTAGPGCPVAPLCPCWLKWVLHLDMLVWGTYLQIREMNNKKTQIITQHKYN